MRKFILITITLSITTAMIAGVANLKWPDEPSPEQGPFLGTPISTLKSLVPASRSILRCLLSPAVATPPAQAQGVRKGAFRVEASWDLVVLGWIDACWVCQFGPSPHVRYTQVLAGKVPGNQASGQLAIVAVAKKLRPEGEVPMYKSQQEEIVFLKKGVVPGNAAAEVYEVVDVLEATPDNLAAFRSR